MNRALLSLAAQRQLEGAAAMAGLDLMRRAACAAADWITRRYAQGSQITVLAGPGNNGGDALHLACELTAAGYAVSVVSPAQQYSPAAHAARVRWDACGSAVLPTLPEQVADLLVDGLFGIGLSRALGAPWDALIASVNAASCPVLALDTPSGLDPMRGHATGAAVRATATLTFLCHKPGLLSGQGSALAGQVYLAPLDVPGRLLPAAEGELNLPSVAALARTPDSHKGSYGTVCVAGGAVGMLGAALLAGRAALASGAGKVQLAVLDGRLAVDPVQPELMIAPLALPLPAHDVCVIGPGLGQCGAARAALAAVLASAQPLLVDADALNLVAGDDTLAQALAARTACAVLTPHPAEAARLLGCSTAAVQHDRVAAARALAARFGKVVVLKGAGSLIARGDGFYRVNASGNAALAVAGQGDVLSGCIAALLAQRLDAFDAASLGVYLHGLTADLYRHAHGNMVGLAASHSAAALAPAINALLAVHHARLPHCVAPTL